MDNSKSTYTTSVSPPKIIVAMRRIDARLEEVRRTHQLALEAGPSEPQMMTRAKGKEVMRSEAQRQEQYNNLKEEELRCQAMQKKLREQQMLDKMQAPPVLKEPAQTNPQQDEPLRVRPRIIPIEEDSELSDSDAKEGEYRRRTHQ